MVLQDGVLYYHSSIVTRSREIDFLAPRIVSFCLKSFSPGGDTKSNSTIGSGAAADQQV